ncbi:hypothetical protein B0T09DRAFT_396496 [Sordaria sp. MPI-SDFR-AT-0083]|nr:hypothetical protein B0T09DRAFT_396496 [Sordaria sp. MPI-SDFR-AT-0083]
MKFITCFSLFATAILAAPASAPAPAAVFDPHTMDPKALAALKTCGGGTGSEQKPGNIIDGREKRITIEELRKEGISSTESGLPGRRGRHATCLSTTIPSPNLSRDECKEEALPIQPFGFDCITAWILHAMYAPGVVTHGSSATSSPFVGYVARPVEGDWCGSKHDS